MTQMTVKVGSGGRFVIPGELRAAMGIEPGDTIVLVLEPDGVLLLTPEQAVRRAQGIVREYVPEGRSLSDELVAERREEADGP